MDYTKAYKLSNNNLPKLKEINKCGCFYCRRIFSPAEINEYMIDENCAIDNKGTAICPYCGIDSIIPETDEFPVTKELLEGLHKYAFEGE